MPAYNNLNQLLSLAKPPLVLGQFTELAMDGLDSIGGVNGGTHIIGILEVGR